MTIKFGDTTITDQQLIDIAEHIAKSDDFVWDEFTEKERRAFADSFVLPIPEALRKVGLKIVRGD